jgi:glycosyltransferase involved in cell wall biosynthesis
VVHVVPALFQRTSGTLGGAERYAFELARHMVRVVPTRLVSFGDEDRQESRDGLTIDVIGHPWMVRGNRNNPFSVRLLGILRNADVVHCHQRSVLASSVLALAGRLADRRVVVTDLGGGGWDFSAYISTDRWYHRHLHISEYSRSVAGHAGQPWAHVISGGVDTAKFPERAVVSPRGPVLFVGRLLPHKGIHDLIAGMPDGIPLEVVGQPYNDSYYSHLQSLAKGRDVTFRRDFDDAALVAAYHRAMCIVLPSVYDSGFQPPFRTPELLGQTLLEGMSCGLPAICTDVASMPEVVANGETGWVVPPNAPSALGERIKWLRERPREAAAMGRAGRRRVEQHFTWEAVVERCLVAYRT